MLHGTVLGHPLHAVVTDIPVGAWTVTAILDALEIFGAPAVPGADAALGIGLGGGALAARAGWADWSDTAGDPRTLGMAHALTNGVPCGVYALAFARCGAVSGTTGDSLSQTAESSTVRRPSSSRASRRASMASAWRDGRSRFERERRPMCALSANWSSWRSEPA